MLRWTFVATALIAVLAGTSVLALDDKDKEKEKLRQEILKKVEERLKAENKRVMDEVRKILEEELSRMDEDEEEEDEPAPVKPPKKPPVVKDEPGYMGVYPEDITAEMRKLLKLKEGQGVLIAGVAEGGPADKGGLKANDVVLEVEGEGVGNGEELREAIQAHKAGESIELKVLRKKEKVTLKIKLAAREAIEPDEEEEGGEEEGDEEPPAKPAKKPKVTFEPRAESPKFDEKTAEDLRKEIERFLDRELEKDPAPESKKSLSPGGHFLIAGPGDEDEEDEAPVARPGREARELAKRFLRDLLERIEESEDEGEEDGEEFPGFDDELRRMMEQFKGMKGEEMEQLKEKFDEMMEKLQDEDYLRDLMEGLNGENLAEQLERMMGQGGSPEDDEENLTDPEEDEEAPAPPKPAPKGGAYLGVQPEDLSPEMRRQLKTESGVLVREVVEDSPAADAGLKEGDVVLEIDGEEVEGPEGLRAALSGLKGGTQVTLTILRKGKKIEKDVTLAAKRKISMPGWAGPSVHDIGDGKPSKKESGKKKGSAKKSNRETSEELELALLDSDGRTILKVPARDAAKLMEMGREFGIPMPGEGGWDGAGEHPERLLGGEREPKKGKKSGKKESARKGDRTDEELHDLFRHLGQDGECPIEKLLERHGGSLERAHRMLRPGGKGGAVPEIFRALKLEGHPREFERMIPREAHRWMERLPEPGCPHNCPECRKKEQGMKKGQRTEKREFRFDLPGEWKKHGKKGGEFEFEWNEPKGDKHKNRKVEKKEYRFEIPKSKAKKGERKTEEFEFRLPKGHPPVKKGSRGGESVEKEMREAHKAMEKALKEFGGDRMPEELREEIEKLMKELKKKSSGGKQKMLAA